MGRDRMQRRILRGQNSSQDSLARLQECQRKRLWDRRFFGYGPHEPMSQISNRAMRNQMERPAPHAPAAQVLDAIPGNESPSTSFSPVQFLDQLDKVSH